jgi:hypothetical protein
VQAEVATLDRYLKVHSPESSEHPIGGMCGNRHTQL